MVDCGEVIVEGWGKLFVQSCIRFEQAYVHSNQHQGLLAENPAGCTVSNTPNTLPPNM